MNVHSATAKACHIVLRYSHKTQELKHVLLAKPKQKKSTIFSSAMVMGAAVAVIFVWDMPTMNLAKVKRNFSDFLVMI